MMSKGISSELRGKFDHKLDPKNRVSIPSEWRLGDECPVYLLEAKKEGKSIVKVLSPEKFKRWVDEIEARDMSMAQKDLIIGKLHADCVGATINAQGKLLIPKRMCEGIGLNTDVKLVGRGAYFELWEPSNFAAAEQLELEKLMELNSELGIF